LISKTEVTKIKLYITWKYQLFIKILITKN